MLKGFTKVVSISCMKIPKSALLCTCEPIDSFWLDLNRPLAVNDDWMQNMPLIHFVEEWMIIRAYQFMQY